MLEVVHYGRLDFHRAIIKHVIAYPVLEQSLDHLSLREVPEVPWIAPLLVIHELELSHDLYVRRLLLGLAALVHLVFRQLLQLGMLLEIETRNLPVFHRNLVELPLCVNYEPFGLQLLLLLQRLGDLFLVKVLPALGRDVP